MTNPTKIRGYAGGTFDLFHPGHVLFLEKCRSLCDFLIVSLNTDEFAGRYKRKPILTLPERRIMLQGCRFVDRVIVNSGDEDSKWPILRSQADIIFHGDDWTGDSLMEQLGINDVWLEIHEIEMKYVPYSPILNTTDLIRRVSDLHSRSD